MDGRPKGWDKWDAKRKALYFSKGRVTVWESSVLKNGDFIDGFRPKVHGIPVRLSGDLHPTKEAAINEGRAYRQMCRDMIFPPSKGR